MIIRVLKKLKVNRIIYKLAVKFFKDKATKYNINQVMSLLEQFSPNPKTSCLIPERPAKSKRYDLDIIVPAYNVEQYIRECLNSVLSQSTKWSYRVIVIDDGSTDRTGEIIDTYKTDKRVKIIHQENRGFSGARNCGLDELDSKYVTFLDSDDILMPHAIEIFLDKAFEFDAAVVEAGFSYISQEGKTKRIEKHKGGKLDPKKDLWGFTCGKILRSDLKITLVDSLQKRVNFLNQLISKLNLKNIVVVHSRAEDFCLNNREKFDYSVSRAVAQIPTLSEYLLPLVKIKGQVLMYKSQKLQEELESGQTAIQVLGGKILNVLSFDINEIEAQRKILIIDKIKQCPKIYPRGKNLPKTKPII